jgi:phospho-2-dehydro-3-deoxyheptonate aldolase
MNTQEILERDWAMDTEAAVHLRSQLDPREVAILKSFVETLSEDARSSRDSNRERIAEVFAGIGSMAVFGPCSLDANVNFEPLHQLVDDMSQTHTNSVIAERGNAFKPRTGPNWRGAGASVMPTERKAVFDFFIDAAERGIPVITEITDSPQLGELAPFLSGQWIGARDVGSSSLRHSFRGIKLPSAIKNGISGGSADVENAIHTILGNTHQSSGSGFWLGSIASSLTSRGIPTGILPAGTGNPNVAVFARGLELPEDMRLRAKKEMAIKHLSEMCIAAVEIDCAVLIDATHSLAPMFGISPKDPQRLLGVLDELGQLIESNEILAADRIRGFVGEVGPEIGRTDPNLVLTESNTKKLKQSAGELLNIINARPRIQKVQPRERK